LKQATIIFSLFVPNSQNFFSFPFHPQIFLSEFAQTVSKAMTDDWKPDANSEVASMPYVFNPKLRKVSH